MKQEIDKYIESIAKNGSASPDEMNETINKFTKILGKNELKEKDNCEKVMPTQETINGGLKILYKNENCKRAMPTQGIIMDI